MPSISEKIEPGRKTPPRPGDGLKRRLTDHLDLLKRPNDVLRITEVSPCHFRVNTLTPSLADDALLTTYRIVKSQFLHVQDKNGELLITDQTRN